MSSVSQPRGNCLATHFDKYEDVPLGRSPLSEVICQVRFPPILRITAESPAVFQDRIRAQFPLVEVVQESILQPAHLPPQAILPVYQFKSQDMRSLVALSVNFFAFSTQSYTTWAAFLSVLAEVTAFVVDTYEPPFATRLGLRYVNKLTPANTDKSTLTELVELLNPELAGMCATSGWSEVQRLETRIHIPDDGPALSLRLAITPEPSVVLDLDYFEQREGIALLQVPEMLDQYHRMLYNAFRWSFKDHAIAIFQSIPS